MILFIIHLSVDCYLLHRTKNNKKNIIPFLIALHLSQSIYRSCKDQVFVPISALYILKLEQRIQRSLAWHLRKHFFDNIFVVSM
jgi:hypothetical protein